MIQSVALGLGHLARMLLESTSAWPHVAILLFSFVHENGHEAQEILEAINLVKVTSQKLVHG